MPQGVTKTRGQIRREEELAAAKRELRVVRETGVATRLQLDKLKSDVTVAQGNLNQAVRQRDLRVATGKELQPARGRPKRRSLTEAMRSRGN